MEQYWGEKQLLGTFPETFSHEMARSKMIPRFPIFPYFSKIKIRWNLLIWFLDLGHLRVCLGKI